MVRSRNLASWRHWARESDKPQPEQYKNIPYQLSLIAASRFYWQPVSYLNVITQLTSYYQPPFQLTTSCYQSTAVNRNCWQLLCTSECTTATCPFLSSHMLRIEALNDIVIASWYSFQPSSCYTVTSNCWNAVSYLSAASLLPAGSATNIFYCQPTVAQVHCLVLSKLEAADLLTTANIFESEIVKVLKCCCQPFIVASRFITKSLLPAARLLFGGTIVASRFSSPYFSYR